MFLGCGPSWNALNKSTQMEKLKGESADHIMTAGFVYRVDRDHLKQYITLMACLLARGFEL